MKRKLLTSICLYSCVYLTTVNAQNLINIGIGPTWPKDLRGTEKPTAWNATIEYGKLFDNIVGFCVDFDFAWNVNIEDSSQGDSIPIYICENENKQFMFPISACLLIDPIPKFVFHPVIKGQLGLNMMVKSLKEYDSTGNEIEKPAKKDESGFYIGIIGKASIDGVYDLGEHVAIFGGFEFQWGRLKRKVKGTANEYFKPKMYGPGVRMGISVLY